MANSPEWPVSEKLLMERDVAHALPPLRSVDGRRAKSVLITIKDSTPQDAFVRRVAPSEYAKLRRRGLRTLTLAVTTESARLAHALNAVEPRAVVVTGQQASLDTLGRLVYAARRHGAEGVTIFDYRGALPSASATTVPRLGDTPLAARDRLLAVLDDPAGARRTTPALRAVSGA